MSNIFFFLKKIKATFSFASAWPRLALSSPWMLARAWLQAGLAALRHGHAVRSERYD